VASLVPATMAVPVPRTMVQLWRKSTKFLDTPAQPFLDWFSLWFSAAEGISGILMRRRLDFLSAFTHYDTGKSLGGLRLHGCILISSHGFRTELRTLNDIFLCVLVMLCDVVNPDVNGLDIFKGRIVPLTSMTNSIAQSTRQ
jgi:hypothetical protein